MKYKILLIIVFLAFISCSMEVYSVLDTKYPITVIEKKSETQYRLKYHYDNQDWFMEIVTDDRLNVGDELVIIKK